MRKAPAPEMVSTRDAAAMFSIHQRVIKGWEAQGLLNRYKVGLKRLVSVAEVRQLIQHGAPAHEHNFADCGD